MIPLISFVIPTYRDFSAFAYKTITSIYESIAENYEIIICSKTKPSINNNKVVYVPEPTNNIGSVLPINLAYHQARGKYVSLLNDDFFIDKTFLNIISFLESDFFKNRKVKIAGLTPNDWIISNDNKFIIDSFPNGKTLPSQLLCFPVGLRDNLLEVLGKNLLDSRFSHHFSDMFLSYFLFKKFNEPSVLCKKSIIYTSICQTHNFNDLQNIQTYNYLTSLSKEDLVYQ